MPMLPLYAAAVATGLMAAPAIARTLHVAPGLAFAAPSQAASAAADGDRIEIAPGRYADCAVWRAGHLTIAATAPGVVITTRLCQGKALFVTVGDAITIEGITFAHASAAEGNGAGIRAEGADLTVRGSRFEDNENGILAGGNPASTIRVTDSAFERNGACIGACAHAIYVGAIALLQVQNCRFSDTRIGHHVKSRALRTELVGNQISDGDGGTASYLVDIPNGGDLVLLDNDLDKGAASDNPRAAVTIGEEGVTHPTRELRVMANRFTSHVPGGTVFVRNLTQTPAELAGNTLAGLVTALQGVGTVR